MDFFSKLDNGRYAEFKTTYLNYLQIKGCSPPKDLNKIYLLASTHVKPKAAVVRGIGSTFATTTDWVDKKLGEVKGRCKCSGKNNSSSQQTQSENQADKNDLADGEQSSKKRVKCLNYGEDHYIHTYLPFGNSILPMSTNGTKWQFL